MNKAQLENQFLKIKSKLAREHNVLYESLQDDYKIDGNTMNIVSGATNLEAIYGQSEVAVKKLQGEWHRAFISINETLGRLEDKKGRAEAGEKIFLPQQGVVQMSSSRGMSKNTKTLLIIVGIAAAVCAFIMSPLGEAWRTSFKDLIGK